jgi:Family of unknown function (DUF6459)
MQQNPPPELPLQIPGPPAGPVVVPALPTRRRPPGRSAPLPDLVAVRHFAVPDSAPPYDDEQDVRGDTPVRGITPRTPPAAPAGPDGRHGPGGPGEREASPGGPGERGASPGGPDRRGAGPSGPDRPGAGLGGWPSQFAQVLAETLAGSRPAQQLTPWTTEQTRKRIRQLGPTLTANQRPRVRRIMTSAPCQDVLEVTAVVGFGPRVRVLALRLERTGETGQQWRCTALESA